MSEHSAVFSETAPGQTGGGLVAIGVGLVGTVISLVVILGALFSEGHAAFNTTSTLPWGFPVAVYVFFVLTSTGLTFVASLGMIFGLKAFMPIAKRCVWLALATLLAGLTTLMMEIGDPIKMIWALPFSFQTASAMWWMGVFYAAYLVLLALKFAKINGGDWDSGASKGLGIASLVSVIIAHTTLGLVFGMMGMRPVWFGGSVPLYFLATAAMSGLAFTVIAVVAAYGTDKDRMPTAMRSLVEGPLPVVFNVMLGVVLLFVIARTITGLWANGEGMEVFDWMVASPLFHIELWLCMVIPFLLLLLPEMRSKPAILGLAGVLVAIGLFIGRYEFIVGGQIVRLFQGTRYPGVIPYTPSMAEVMMLVYAVSITLLIYGLGAKFLKLEESGR